MEKPAAVKYPIHDLLRQRWSPRAFADRAVEPAKLQSLFDDLRHDHLGPRVRLEQERISFGWLEKALEELPPPEEASSAAVDYGAGSVDLASRPRLTPSDRVGPGQESVGECSELCRDRLMSEPD